MQVATGHGRTARRFIPVTFTRLQRVTGTAAIVLLLTAASGCSPPAANFSQYPGFRDWYAAHPPAEVPPSEADRALLARYRPRLFVDRESEGPIGFYEDYVAEATLLGGD